MLVNKIKSNFVEIILLVLLFVVSFYLRFPDLGYSDYIGDEHKSFIELRENQSVWNFFMEQRKGPMQFLVSYIPYFFTGDWHNEFAERLPFTIFGFASIFIFYAFIKKITDNKWAAFVSAFLLSTNGFIIGFSRIAQYQNLNLFFSFAALYFYSDFLKPSKHFVRRTLLGTISFSLSLLSHWDAIFILIPVSYFYISYLLNKDIPKKEKIRITSVNLSVGGLLLLPFLIPYVRFQFLDQANKEYFGRRVELGHINYERYNQLFTLYNPFLLKEFLIASAVVSLFFIKRNWIYLLWFIVNYGLFELFVRKPGTHIYNFVIPLIVLASLGIVYLIEKMPKFLRALLSLVPLLFFIFFSYQSYVIFIDHTVEYPWEKESLFENICEPTHNAKSELTDCGEFVESFTTPEYGYDDKLPLFGFPLSRNWNEINAYINEQNLKNEEPLGYMTNEVKTIAEWYMDAKYTGTGDFYLIGVKKPLSFVEDWKMKHIGNRELVTSFENNGTEVVRIYKVEDYNE